MRGVLANGELIKRLRKSPGLTQAQLAVRARCDVKTARRAEQGQSLDMFVLRNIAAVLEVPYSDVVQKARGRRSREMLHLENVRRWMDAFNNRNLPELLESFHPQCVLRVPGSPELAAAGVFRGRSELSKLTQLVLRLNPSANITAEGMRHLAVLPQLLAPSKIVLRHGSSLITEDGGITMSGNAAGTDTTIHAGVRVFGLVETRGTGPIHIFGRASSATSDATASSVRSSSGSSIGAR